MLIVLGDDGEKFIVEIICMSLDIYELSNKLSSMGHSIHTALLPKVKEEQHGVNNASKYSPWDAINQGIQTYSFSSIKAKMQQGCIALQRGIWWGSAFSGGR